MAICLGNNQDLIFDILEESLVLSRNFDFVHGSALYCVYVTNLSADLPEILYQHE